MPLVQYNQTDDPEENGVYACRMKSDVSNLHIDRFLSWFDGQWYFMGSDQKYRGNVTGWIGPLQRRM